MQEEQYNEYLIEGTAYQDEDTERWVPQATIKQVREEGGPRENYPLTWEREFDTREEAEAFAVQSAQFYIDNHF